MSHTPGPWGFKDQDGSGNPDSPYIIGQQSAIDDDDGYWVAEVTAGVPDELSNAFLIAAAPDLLRVLLAAIEYVKVEAPRSPLANDMETVIAKATGQIESG